MVRSKNGPSEAHALGSLPWGMKITGVGGYVPGEPITNEAFARQLADRGQKIHELSNGHMARAYDWAKMSDEVLQATNTSDEWIKKRTGFGQRHLGPYEEAVSDLAVACGRPALDSAGVGIGNMDFVICGTVTNDHLYTPSTPAVILHKLGHTGVVYDDRNKPAGIHSNTFSVDVSSACTTFGAGMQLAYGLISSGLARKGIVFGAEVLDKAGNDLDRSTAVLFARGAGAFVVEAVPRSQDDFHPDRFLAGTEASHHNKIICRVGGSAAPYTPEIMKDIVMYPWKRPDKIWQDGGFVLEFMVRFMADVCLPETLEKARLKWSDIDHAFLHQANSRLIAAIVQRLKKREGGKHLPIFHDTGMYYCNTSSATLPLGAWHVQHQDWLERIRAASENRQPLPVLNDGDGCLFSGFGGGFTWANWISSWSTPKFLPTHLQDKLEEALLQSA